MIKQRATAGTDTELTSRVSALENGISQVVIYENIDITTTTTGSVTLPTGATVNTVAWQIDDNAVLSQLDSTDYPIEAPPSDGNDLITVNMDASGNWTVSGAYAGNSNGLTGLLYVVNVATVDKNSWSATQRNKIIEDVPIDPTFQDVYETDLNTFARAIIQIQDVANGELTLRAASTTNNTTSAFVIEGSNGADKVSFDGDAVRFDVYTYHEQDQFDHYRSTGGVNTYQTGYSSTNGNFSDHLSNIYKNFNVNSVEYYDASSNLLFDIASSGIVSNGDFTATGDNIDLRSINGGGAEIYTANTSDPTAWTARGRVATGSNEFWIGRQTSGAQASIQANINNFDGIRVTDTTSQIGLFYAGNYSTEGPEQIGARWIPDLGYMEGNFFPAGTLTSDVSVLGASTYDVTLGTSASPLAEYNVVASSFSSINATDGTDSAYFATYNISGNQYIEAMYNDGGASFSGMRVNFLGSGTTDFVQDNSTVASISDTVLTLDLDISTTNDANWFTTGDDVIFWDGASTSSNNILTLHGDGNHSLFDPFVTLHEGFATANGTFSQSLIMNIGKAAALQWNDGTRSVALHSIEAVVNAAETVTHMETDFYSVQHKYVNLDNFEWYFDTAGTVNTWSIYDDDDGTNEIFSLDDGGNQSISGTMTAAGFIGGEFYSSRWAEESATLSAATDGGYQFSFGNGETGQDAGVSIYVPAGYTCQWVGMTMNCKAAWNATITAVLNGTPQTQSITGNETTAPFSTTTTFATPITITNGDKITFQTTSVTTAADGGVPSAELKFTKTS